jgi:hypothetical protein
VTPGEVGREVEIPASKKGVVGSLMEISLGDSDIGEV